MVDASIMAHRAAIGTYNGGLTGKQLYFNFNFKDGKNHDFRLPIKLNGGNRLLCKVFLIILSLCSLLYYDGLFVIFAYGVFLLWRGQMGVIKSVCCLF